MSEKKIRDPIHGLITFNKKEEKVLLDIIDSPYSQRLRRIRQLGFSYYTYPTATHDRLSHSLGVCYLIDNLFKSLNVPNEIEVQTVNDQDEPVLVKISKEEAKLLLKMTALLHDIGHGPFSHAFEKVTGIKHENFSKQIIKEYIASILEKNLSSDNLKKYAVKWIIEILDGTFQPIWMKELISSQLDMDRTDYLLRDAYMCGVKYASFDIQWLFGNMLIEEIKAEEREGLVVDARKGLYAIESFLLSRYHMYEQVYFHKTTRCFELITQKILERVKELHKLQKINENYFLTEEFFNFLIKDPSLENFFYLDDYCILTHINHWGKITEDDILKELCDCIINRKPYKIIAEVERDYKKISDLEKILQYEVFQDDKLKFNYFFLIDDYQNVPYKDLYLLGKRSSQEAEHIWLKYKDTQKELSEVSPVIKALKNKEFTKYRAYLFRDLIPEYKRVMEAKNEKV